MKFLERLRLDLYPYNTGGTTGTLGGDRPVQIITDKTSDRICIGFLNATGGDLGEGTHMYRSGSTYAKKTLGTQFSVGYIEKGGPDGARCSIVTRFFAISNGAPTAAVTETLAKSNITVSAAGATADTITVKVNGATVGTYANASSDSIATLVTGIRAAINAATLTNGGYTATAGTGSGNFYVVAPTGSGINGNSLIATVVTTGAAAATITTGFTGGVSASTMAPGTLLRGLGTYDSSGRPIYTACVAGDFADALLLTGVNASTAIIVGLFSGAIKV